MRCKHAEGGRIGQKNELSWKKLYISFEVKREGATLSFAVCVQQLNSALAKKFIDNDLIRTGGVTTSHFLFRPGINLAQCLFIIITYITDMFNLNIQDTNGI